MPPSAAPSPPRIAALDAARALGVVAMVAGHTLDATLSLSFRAEPLAIYYWHARGFTAPLFLVASGWAVTVALRRSGATGWEILQGRVPRVLLLLGVGYALRWPGWGTELLRAGDPATWAHLLAFEPLHTIALSVLAAALVLGLPWTVREKALAFVALVALAVALGTAAPAPLVPHPSALPPSPFGMALAQVVGGTSPFPIFPWAGYFFAGAIVGLLGSADGRRRVAAMAALGAALVAATCWAGVGTMPPGHPVLFVFRVGTVLLLLAALSIVPRTIAARLGPLGRVSLPVYALHVAVVYGWSTHEGLAARIGPVLPPARALLLAGAVLGGSVAVALALVAVLRTVRSMAPVALERGADVAVALLRGTRGAGER